MQNIGFLEFFVKEKTKTRAPAHLRNHSKSVGIARTLLKGAGAHYPGWLYGLCAEKPPGAVLLLGGIYAVWVAFGSH